MNHSTATFYNRISFLYPLINYFLKRQRRILIEEVNHARPGKLLEIGVGNGSHLPLYISHEITCIDISASMLKKARRFAGDNIQLTVMNGEHLLFEEACFDYVVLSHVLAVTKDPELMLAEVYRVLKPGGKLFVLNHFTPDNWLKYLDRAFQPLSSIFHFRSSFSERDISAFQRFFLLSKKAFGRGAYFKLLIFCKP